ncbi:MAG: helix-hairpin-helix domain-containing protein [Bacteroidales bacterium]|nr:helix-hairpin-helix domain-containing protein [Bacteroidales bacterium]
MLSKLKRTLQSFFILNKREQRGSLVLLVLILLAIIIYYSLPSLVRPENSTFKKFKQQISDFSSAQQQIRDSIYIESLQNTGKLDSNLASQKIKPFPFDPNNLASEKWKSLGLTAKQIRTIKNYEAKGGRFRKKEDLKKIYGISENEYKLLAPFIRIPSGNAAKKTENGENEKIRTTTFTAIEINTADSFSLVGNLKLAPWLAARTIKYRELLGGFYRKGQLSEVYGFDSGLLEQRSRAIMVDTAFVRKLDINRAGFKQLVRHPYISYELTKYIVNTRQANGGFNSVQELKGSPLVSEPLFGKLRPYLKAGK